MTTTGIAVFQTGDVEHMVRWTGDGSYTPVCLLCEWCGVPRWKHSAARAAARSHRASARHQKKMRCPADPFCVLPYGHAGQHSRNRAAFKAVPG